MIILRARVIPHRFIDEVIDRAIKVVRHLLERLPQDVPAVEMAHRLLALIHLGLALRSCDFTSPYCFFSSLSATAVASAPSVGSGLACPPGFPFTVAASPFPHQPRSMVLSLAS